MVRVHKNRVGGGFIKRELFLRHPTFSKNSKKDRGEKIKKRGYRKRLFAGETRAKIGGRQRGVSGRTRLAELVLCAGSKGKNDRKNTSLMRECPFDALAWEKGERKMPALPHIGWSQ